MNAPLTPSSQVNVAADQSWAELGKPGAQWTGAERIAIAELVRAASPRPLWDRAPALDALAREPGGDVLSPFVAGLVERVAVEPSSLSKDDVAGIVAQLGDAAYAELASVVAQVVAIDHFAAALGVERRGFPSAEQGHPHRRRPEGMADVGGHIPMTEVIEGPNVRRSLSLAGADHERWMMLVFVMYSGERFGELVWTDRALSRPQVELLAARTSALNECFY
jgi:hypothetical protein